MAAPMDSVGSAEDEQNIEEIDVLSPKFDPLKALYAEKTILPIADASCFNNLAEYERFMSKSKSGEEQVKDKVKPKQLQHGSGPVLPAPETMSKRAFERLHKQHMLEKEKELPTSTRFQKKKHVYNVLSRMESACTEESPIDLLRQCVEKRCKVRVCVRSFKGLRSVCIGYLVAFDKIWNMALIDVDEIYKRPSTGKRFHHEEKVTYSMLMANRNPPKPKADATNAKDRKPPDTTGKKKRKECKFCRIMHEAILEQEAAEDMGESSSSGSETDSETSGDDTDGGSSTEESSSNADLKSEKRRDGDREGKKLKRTPKKHSDSCPNGHGRGGSSLKDRSGLKASKCESEAMPSQDGVKSDKKSPIMVESTSSSKAGTASVSAKASSVLKTSGIQSYRPNTTATKHVFESTSRKARHATQKSSRESALTSTTTSLSAEFSKVVSINPAAKEIHHSHRKSSKEQKQSEAKPVKEIVHLDPSTQKRLIQPEEFKRRHVNQLFIRGDNVVLVSVDSEMVDVEVKKADANTVS